MKHIIKAEQKIAMILLLLMSILAFAQVITRYVFQYPTPWLEELTRYFMVWMVFICFGLAVAKKAHLRVEVVDYFASPALARKINGCLEVFMVIFGILFTIISFSFTVRTFSVGQTSPAMQMPMGLVYLGMLIGAVLFTVHMARNAYSTITGKELDIDEEEELA